MRLTPNRMAKLPMIQTTAIAIIDFKAEGRRRLDHIDIFFDNADIDILGQ